MSWDRTEHDFGLVRENQICTTDFKYTGTKKVKSVQGTCGCTQAMFTDSVTLSVTINVGSVYQGEIKSKNVKVIVTFEDNTSQSIKLTAKVRKHNAVNVYSK